MAILDIYDRISSSINRNKFSIAVFIDLSKAFDTLNHQILLDKEYYGIRGLPLKLFEGYLHNRQQCVHIENVTSTLPCVSCGVPQGFILGTLLFFLYINDIVMF